MLSRVVWPYFELCLNLSPGMHWKNARTTTRLNETWASLRRVDTRQHAAVAARAIDLEKEEMESQSTSRTEIVILAKEKEEK